MASHQQFWNSTNCGVGTLCIEKWDPIGTYSVWIIISKGVLTEGTLSLIITLIAMAVLVLLFFVHNYHWEPSYDAKSPEERLAWLTVSDGIQNGNVVIGVANTILLWAMKRLDMRKWVGAADLIELCDAINFDSLLGAFNNSIVGVSMWIVVSLISAAAQLSIHSVTALEHTFVSVKKLSMPALNLSFLMSGHVPPTFTDEVGTSRDGVNFSYPVPLHVNVGYAILSGIPQNISSYAFALDGSVCSGQLFYDTTLKTKCLMDSTTCLSDNVVWSPQPNDTEKFSRSFVDLGRTSNYSPSPPDLLNISNLVILKNNDPGYESLNDGGNIILRKKISGVRLKYFLRSRGSTPFPNLTLWEVFDSDEDWMEP
ncbi:hypothetical protein HDU67_002713, partial [Dinochytrium kinnereticum]